MFLDVVSTDPLMLLLVAATLVGRALAIMFGLFVMFDAAMQLFGHPLGHESGPRNEWGETLSLCAWFVLGFGVIGGASTFIYEAVVNYKDTNSFATSLGAVFIWTFLALGFSLRAAARATQPGMLLVAAGGMHITGIILVAVAGGV